MNNSALIILLLNRWDTSSQVKVFLKIKPWPVWKFILPYRSRLNCKIYPCPVWKFKLPHRSRVSQTVYNPVCSFMFVREKNLGEVVQSCMSSNGAVILVLITPLNCWRNCSPLWCKASLCTIKIDNFRTYHMARAYSTLSHSCNTINWIGVKSLSKLNTLTDLQIILAFLGAWANHLKLSVKMRDFSTLSSAFL